MNTTSRIALGAALIAATPAWAQETTPTRTSMLASINLPANALRVNPKSAPREIEDALAQMMKAGGAKVKRGKTEVIAWVGNGYSLKRVPKLKSGVASAFKSGGWTYEEGEPLPEAEGFTMVSALKTEPSKKALIGFWAPGKDALLLAWTEMIPANPAPAEEPAAEEPAAEDEILPDEEPAALAPRAATAQATSQSTDIAMPKSLASWDDLAPRFTALLTSLSKEKHANLDAPQVLGEADSLGLRGAAYKEGRASFIQMSLTGALSKAGYEVRALDTNQIGGTNLFTHFPSDEASPFAPDIWKLPIYLVGTSPKGDAVLAAILDSGKELAVGVLKLKTAAPSQPAPPPASGLVRDPNDVMKGIAPPRMTFAKMLPKPRTVRGQVRDAGGKPITGAVVHAESSGIGGIRTLHTARTDASGLYQVLVPSGVCRVSAAFATVAYNGKSYGLPLHPADGELEQFDSQKGHVENFSLRTWGATGMGAAGNPKDFRLYYGGSLRLSWMSEIEPGGTFEVTVKPVGALLGGGKGRTFVHRFENKQYAEAHLNDIPLGRYQVSARLLLDGDEAPLRLEFYGLEKTPSPTLTVDFEPVSAENPDFGSSPVRQAHILLRP